MNLIELCGKRKPMEAKKETKKKKEFRVKNQDAYDFAYMLYMNKTPQKEIAARVGVSQQTLTAWKEKGGWELKRSARTVSREEIINKILKKINDMLDDDPEKFNADDFSKAATQIKNLKVGVTVDDIAEILTRFGDWLIEKSASDLEINAEFVQKVTKYQDMYLQMRIKNG